MAGPGIRAGWRARFRGLQRAAHDVRVLCRGVDWADVAQVERALQVFESQLRWLARQDWHRANSLDEVRELLDDDGFELDERCQIHWRRPSALEATLAGLTDPSGIRAELERIRRALPDDPAGAIGAAKQLVEATAKVVLTERSLPVAGDAKVPELVKAAQQALQLHPSSTIPGPDSSEAVKKILGGVSSIAVGVAELRNRGYGSGHGHVSTPTGLSRRHAHLAVNAAITWCHSRKHQPELDILWHGCGDLRAAALAVLREHGQG
jgi:hypothetical protein